jgi:replicative DNA helicase
MIYNSQTEQSVIGAIFFLNGYGEAVDSVFDMLTANDFYDQSHKKIFSAMKDCLSKGITPDSSAVSDHRFCSEYFVYCLELHKNTSSGINILKNTESLKKLSELRRTQERVTAINEIISAEGDIDEKLKEIDELFNLDVGFVGSEVGAKHISDCMSTYLDRLQTRWENPESVVFSTGIPDLDTILGGGFEVGLHAIGANPKMGKTELMGKMVNHFAVDKGMPVYVGSLEMPDFQVIERLVSSYGRIDKSELKNDFPDMNDDKRFTQHALHAAACQSVGNSNIYIDDRHTNTVLKIRRECRKILKKHGSIGGIFVDYLTLLDADGKHDRNDLAVASMTRALKGMSKEFMCPVIMLLQLNRGNTARQDKRPLASDSRDSGSIEQDVDSWTGLYKDSVYNTDSPWKNITEIIVRLNRHGETGTCYQQLTGHGFVDVNEYEVARLVNIEESAPKSKTKDTGNF